MRNMSFMLTTEQMYSQTKLVTRRQGWDFLKIGDIIQAVEKCQGIPKGGHIKKIGKIIILETRWEPIFQMIHVPQYGESEVILEGFPQMTPKEFVEMYCNHNKVKQWERCNRIRFDHVVE